MQNEAMERFREEIEPGFYRWQYHSDTTFTGISKTIIFDLDDTLIKRKSRMQAPTDYVFLYDAFPRLRQLLQTHLVMIYSNQRSISYGQLRILETVRHFAEHITRDLERYHLEIFVAGRDDHNRKPNIHGFTTYLLPELQRISTKIHFVGDAAGRAGDHSSTDRKFAFNMHLVTGTKVRFQTPEQYFLGADAKIRSFKGLIPSRVRADRSEIEQYQQTLARLHSAVTKRTLVLMIGAPGSGKTTVADQLGLATGATVLHRDQLKHRFLNSCAATPLPLIVDATHPSPSSRQLVISTKSRTETPDQILLVHCRAPYPLAMHLNRMRANHGGTLIPETAYNIYYKEFNLQDSGALTPVVSFELSTVVAVVLALRQPEFRARFAQFTEELQ